MAVVPLNCDALSVMLGPHCIAADGETVETTDLVQGSRYVALCFSASYCKHCAHFMPKFQAVVPLLRQRLGVEPLLFCNDATEEAYAGYLKKTGLPALAWDATQVMKPILREAWRISTIPHVVLLDSMSGAVVQLNVRFKIEALNDVGEAALEKFLDAPKGVITTALAPAPALTTSPKPKVSLGYRLFGKSSLFDMGHKVSAGSEDQFMDEQSVRIRAGLLHLTSWTIILQHFFKAFGDVNLVPIIFPLVSFEFFTSAMFGLTPFSPYGVAGNLIAHTLRLHVDWKPARPKRFSWFIGLGLASVCLTANLLEVTWLFRVALFSCWTATWLEAACGFCVGCFIWNHILTPALGLKACEECKM